jgi:hypothetical protein
MCFNKEISLQVFVFSIISSLLLIILGNKENIKENYLIAIFFSFVSLMQYVEYLMWKDIECKTGENKFATKIGPLLNHLQPILLYLLIIFVLQKKSNMFISSINIIYLIYVINKYIEFNNKNITCTKVLDSHLNWPWKYDYNYDYFQLVMIINMISYLDSNLLILPFILSYVLYIYYANNYNKFVGELWCFSVNSMPLISLIYQKL